ncbi:hypothetical protein XELAEV_18044684mg [Xenopus laevis]|uniref:Uncharacterized protein n=1 Tax=Xenopus laevis TaxID=8355 RepID=A0A974H3I7_XENLA|nr:hypothetical protein XELAEV_18044684mg [Xenopus laevis]
MKSALQPATNYSNFHAREPHNILFCGGPMIQSYTTVKYKVTFRSSLNNNSDYFAASVISSSVDKKQILRDRIIKGRGEFWN